MYPKTPGCFSDLSAALYYKAYCFFLKLLIVLPVHFPLLHFTPPKVLRFYYNLTFRCVRYFGGSALLNKLLKSLKKSILMKDICEYRMRQYTHTCMLCQKANSRNNYWGSCVVRENVAISALLAWGSPESLKIWL